MKNTKRMVVLFARMDISETPNSGENNIIREKYEAKLNNDLRNISDKLLLSPPLQIAEWLDVLNVEGCVVSWTEESEDKNRQIRSALESLEYIKAVHPDDHYTEKKGEWELKVYFRAKGSKSEGPQGFLLYQGKPVVAKQLNEEVGTDLGRMKYYGEFGKDVVFSWEPSGWNHANRKDIKRSCDFENNCIDHGIADPRHMEPTDGLVWETGTNTVYFANHYANHAWGTILRGWFIGGNGNVMYYDLSPQQANEWKDVDQDGYILKQDLEHNYDMAQKQVASVSREELSKHIAESKVLITDSFFSEPVTTAFDYGEYSLVCYWWDSVREQYKRIFLLQEGDFRQVNMHPAAVELAQWLKAFDGQAFKPKEELVLK